MRLICGVFHLDGVAANERTLRAMAAQMDVPRLSPSLRLWCDGSIGLAVLDFTARGARHDLTPRGGPAALLPQSGGAVMAADARLDQPDALFRELDSAVPFEDDALLLAMLVRFGPAGLDRVLGDFAFACWNPRQQVLTCGRDLFGIRPFSYVYQPGRLFAFASLPVALHGGGFVPKRIDEDALARRMAFLYRFDDSLITGIKRLPPAHSLAVSRTGIALTRYWQLDPGLIGSRHCSDEDAARETRRLVDQAVACRLPRSGTGEIGSHLSGGLDSSAIAVLAARKLRQSGRILHAYSFVDRPRNDVALEDESAFVQTVLAQEDDLDWTPIQPSARLPSAGDPLDPDKMAPLDADEPENVVCARAEAQGVNLLLSGWGGDEAMTFNGRGGLAELFRRGQWPRVAREIAALKRERGWSRSRIFYSEILSYLLPASAITLVKRMIGKDPDLINLFPQALSAEARQALAASGESVLADGTDGNENRWRAMTSPHITHRAEVWAQTGARYGLAYAFPLLDRRVVEYALSLPSAQFLREGFRRQPFRAAMADVLPTKIRLQHEKYRPFPGHLLDLADSRDAFLARLGAYEQNDRIRRLIDLVQLRRWLLEFPSPDQARAEMRGNHGPKATAIMLAAAHALKAAAYLEQHGG